MKNNEKKDAADPTTTPEASGRQFISFTDFKNKFVNTFLTSSDQGSRIIYNGKDSLKKEESNIMEDKKDSDVAKYDDVTGKQSLSELYEELKKETQDEKNKMKESTRVVNKIHKKENGLENKKKELVSLLNELSGEENRLVYDGKRVSLAKAAMKDVSSKSKVDDNEHENKDSGLRSMEGIFLDAFKKDIRKRIAAKEQQKKATENEKKDVEMQKKNVEKKKKNVEKKKKDVGKNKKEMLRKYLLDYINTLEDSHVTKKDDSKSNHNSNNSQNDDRYEDELEDISSNKKTPKAKTELTEALEGFKFSKRDAENTPGRP